MQDIYNQHAKAFSQVQAFTAFKLIEGKITNEVRVAFKFPKDGAGRLYCYLHVIGVQMVRGMAGGYGYDKRSAAIMDAAKRVRNGEFGDYSKEIESLQNALSNCESQGYDRALRDAGYTILTAI